MVIDSYVVAGMSNDREPGAETLLREMDRAQVDRALVFPPPRGYAWENKSYNDFMLRLSREHADRLIPTATATPWRSDFVGVVNDALDAGARVVSFSPDVQGFNPATEMLDGLLDSLSGSGRTIPVYLHTGQYAYSTVSQVFILATRFPEIRFILGHAGATDFGSDVLPALGLRNNLYFETSFARPKSMADKIAAAGAGRAIVGSGFPYNDMNYEWSEIRRLVPEPDLTTVSASTLINLLGESHGD